MKKKNISIICLMGAALLFASATAAIIPATAPSDEVGNDGGMEDSVIDEAPEAVDDGIGMALPFPAVKPASNLASSLHAAVGVQSYVRDEEAGTRDLRFVVAIENYEGLKEGHFTRTVEKLDGTVLKEEATFDIDAVYETLHAESGIKWSTKLDDYTDYVYAVYTLRGIPEASAYDSVVDLSFSGTNTDGTTVTATQTANLAGVLGSVGAVGVNISEDTTTGTFYAHNNRNARGTIDAVVPETGVSIKEGTTYVGEPGGAITELRSISNTGTFENYSSMKSVSLPATITSFGVWCFSGCNALETLPLPRDLTTIAASSAIGFGSSSALTKIDWDAKNLASIGSTISKNVDLIEIAADVEALPQDRIFASGYAPLRINYAGTTAEWNALLEASKGTDASYTGGLDIDNVWCSDTTEATVTYHLGASTVTYDGESRTGDYAITIISGKTAPNIGNPVLEGQYFFGWSTSEAGTEEDLYDFSSAVTANLDLYPVFGAAPAGTTFANPLEVTGAVEETSITLPADYPFYYIKFAPAEAGTYYVNINNLLDASGSASDGFIVVYDESQAEQDYGNWESNPFVDLTGSTNSNYSDSERFVRIVADAGDVYYLGLAADGSYSTYTGTTAAAGSLTFSVTMSAGNDSADGATVLTKGGDAASFVALQDENRYYKYVADAAGEVYLTATHNVAFYYSVYSYDPAAAEPAYTRVVSSTYVGSSTALGAVLPVEAGLEYYIVINSGYDVPGTSSTEYSLTISLTDVPAGKSVGSPAAIPASGTAVEITSAQLAYYYSYTPATTGTYSFKLEGSNSGYVLRIAVYTAAGDILAEGTAESVQGEYYTYETTVEIFQEMEASTEYVIMVGYRSAYSAMEATFTYGYVEPGSRIEASIGVTWTDNALTVASSAEAATYYKWTETAEGAGTYDLIVTSDDAEATATVQTVSSYGTATTILSLAAGGNIKFEPVADTTYYLTVTSATETTITLTKGEYVPPLQNYAFADSTTAFKGGYEGRTSVYQVVYGPDEYWFNGSSYSTEIGSANEDVNGNLVIADLSSTSANTRSYVKGTEVWITRYTSDFYFMSTRFTGTTIDAEYVATSGATSSEGVIIQSLVIDDGTRLYAAMVEGNVYIGCAVTFLEGTSIESGTFTIGYEGMEIGTFDGADGVLTPNNTSAIKGYYGANGASGTLVTVNIGTDVATVATADGTSYDFTYESHIDDTYTFAGIIGEAGAYLKIVDNENTFTAAVVDDADAAVTLGTTATETLPATALHYMDATVVNITPEVTHDATYPWTYEESAGTYTAPSGHNGTTCWLTFTNNSDNDCEFTFSYDISTEGNWDGMLVGTGDKERTSVTYVEGFSSNRNGNGVNSGTVTGEMTVTVKAGESLHIGYQKDGSGASGNDNIIISGLTASYTTYSLGELVRAAA